MTVKRWAVALTVALFLGVVSVQIASAQEVGPISSESCLFCHEKQGLELVLPSGELLPVTVDVDVYNASVHGRIGITCQSCHTDIAGYPHGKVPAQDHRDLALYYTQTCANCHEDQAMHQVDSVHARVLASGVREAATCVDCHGSHEIQWANQEKHPEVSNTVVVEMCSQCHSTITEKFRTSVHGEALYQGDPNVPDCSGCHPAHTIEDPRTLEFRLFSPELCGSCHADKELMAEYGISTEVFDTYVADFHGTTVMLFEKTAPNRPTNKAVCTDCHGAHAIQSASIEDLALKANLVETCRPCHPDATVNFASSWLGHYAPDWQRYPMITAVNWFYKILIPGLVGFFILYILLDAQRRVRNRIKGEEAVR